MKNKLCELIANEVKVVTVKDIMPFLEEPSEIKMGDLSLPCFKLAKKLRKSPTMIAEELKINLDDKKDRLGLEKIETVNGYLNFFFNKEYYVEKCYMKFQQDNLGVQKVGEGKVVCIDYSSPNIAKNFHVGHLRTTIIGNSLYKIHEKLGYKVVRINHLGDWGTQFGKLIVAYLKWSSKARVEERGIQELLDIYVRFNEESKKDENLMNEARQWFVKMEKNDEMALKIWKWFKEISMKEFQRVYKMLKMSFDSYTGESFYRDKVPALVDELEKKKLIKDSQGAKVIDLSQYDMPPCLILKNDGSSIYHSRDIAAVLYRKNTYHFDKCLYVTGMEQMLHFKQVFKAIELMGYEWKDSLIHIPYGLVSLAGQKLSSRNGNVIYAEDILNESIARALKSINEKNGRLHNKEEVAKKIGVGAIIFHDLSHQRIKNIDFVWDEVLSFDGATGPYVQYTYARASSILRKAGYTTKNQNINYELLTDDISYNLIKTLNKYETAVREAGECYEPSIIAKYLIRVTSSFNKFYHNCSILQTEDKVKDARLALVDVFRKVVKDGCYLLGMECPEEM